MVQAVLFFSRPLPAFARSHRAFAGIEIIAECAVSSVKDLGSKKKQAPWAV